MMSCEKWKFPCSFFILLTQWQILFSKIEDFHIFIIFLPLKLILFLKSPYLTAHIKLNYETGCTGRLSEKKMYPQRFSYYFETLWCFTKFFFQHKWNEVRLLVINMVYTSCLSSTPTTSDLGSEEIRKGQENLKT